MIITEEFLQGSDHEDYNIIAAIKPHRFKRVGIQIIRLDPNRKDLISMAGLSSGNVVIHREVDI